MPLARSSSQRQNIGKPLCHPRGASWSEYGLLCAGPSHISKLTSGFGALSFSAFSGLYQKRAGCEGPPASLPSSPKFASTNFTSPMPPPRTTATAS